MRNNNNKIVPHASHTHTHTYHQPHTPTHTHTRRQQQQKNENLSKFKAKLLICRALCPRRWFSFPLSFSHPLCLSLSASSHRVNYSFVCPIFTVRQQTNTVYSYPKKKKKKLTIIIIIIIVKNNITRNSNNKNCCFPFLLSFCK